MRWVIESFQVMVFAGIGRRRCGFLAKLFLRFLRIGGCDSFGLEMIEGW
jgi:hypothetical protein